MLRVPAPLLVRVFVSSRKERVVACCPLRVVGVRNSLGWVVQRFGKYKEVLEPGLRFLIPFVDRVAYRHSLKVCASHSLHCFLL